MRAFFFIHAVKAAFFILLAFPLGADNNAANRSTTDRGRGTPQLNHFPEDLYRVPSYSPLPVATFIAPDDLCINAGVQPGLGGGSPSGGVYSGPGVTDDGNGLTFSFDPTAAGVGTHSITYELPAPGEWQQVGADTDGKLAGDFAGWSVDLSSDGNRLVLGARDNDTNGSNAGQARIYEWNGSAWVQLGQDINGEAAGNEFGYSVTMSADGDRVAIGARLNSGNGGNSGHVRVFEWNSGSWVQLGGDIDGEAADDQSGNSVSISSDGNRLAIGGYLNDGNGTDAGHARIFEWNGTNWVQLGADIDGEAAGDYFGFSVSLSSDGNQVAIGSRFNDGNGSNSGHVRVFSWNGSAWVQLGADIDGEAAFDLFGYSTSISPDGSRFAAGAIGNDGNGSSAGHVRIFEWTGTSWVQVGADIDGELAGDQSGFSVSLSSNGSSVAIGAFGNDGNGGSSGHVRVYSWNGSAWTQTGGDIDGEASGDFSGYAVSLTASGDRVGIGAFRNDGNGTDAGHVRVFDLSPGIPDMASDEIVVNALPEPIMGDVAYCEGTNGVILDAGTGFVSYLWSPGGETTSSISAFAGSYAVSVIDANGCVGTSPSVEVTENPNPVADAGMDASILLGSTFTLGGAPAASGGTSPYTFNWTPENDLDDPAAANPVAGPQSEVTYELLVLDANGCMATDDVSITVIIDPCAGNLPPSIDLLDIPLDPLPLGTGVTAEVSFSDPDDQDGHTAVWEWGDGATEAVAIEDIDQVNNVFSNEHLYTSPGVYTITLTLVDACGDEVSQTSATYIVIYDQSAGFVTGGGWITSPPGAYIADPNLEGKANFGFVAKYKPGQSIPDGNTQFHFNAAGFKFKSTDYDWLTIAGPQAKYKGSGMVNNQGDFGFMLTAIDGQINGGGDEDKFRIKIWDKNNNDQVVYDNKMNEDDLNYQTQELGGGSITIHKDGTNGNALSINYPTIDQRQTVRLSVSPNPFREVVSLSVALPRESSARISIFSAKGQLIRIFELYQTRPGTYQLEWDGRNKNGEILAGGIYFARLEVGTESVFQQLILIR